MTIKLQGSFLLKARLSRLKTSTAKKVVKQALRAAAKPIIKDARTRAPKQSGLLKKSLGSKEKLYPKGNAVVIIGPRVSVVGTHDGKKRWPVKYAHLVERGFIARNGRHVPGKPFLKPAFDSHKKEAQAALKAKLKQAIDKERKK